MANYQRTNGFFNRLFQNKKFTVPFSIIAAIALWLVITVSANPQREATVSGLTVSVETENTVVRELGLDIIDTINEKISVVVSGPTYIVSSLTSKDLAVTADISAVNSAGTYEVALVASRASGKAGYNVVSVVPDKITLTFDYINDAEFVIEPVANGASALSGLIVDTPVVTKTSESVLKIRGPRSYIEKISAVKAIANVNATLSQTTSYDAKIVILDGNGEELDQSNFTLQRDRVQISVPIYKAKTVKLVPTFINTPAGYEKSPLSYTLGEKEIEIKGTPDVIAVIEEIKLAPIDFYMISDTNNSFDVALALPTGVKTMENVESVTVKLNTSGYMMRTFTVSDCRAVNLAEGLSVEKSSPVRNVKVFGPENIVRKLTASSLYAEVDLSGKTAGQYTIAVKIKSDTSDKIWQVGTYSTVVVIK